MLVTVRGARLRGAVKASEQLWLLRGCGVAVGAALVRRLRRFERGQTGRRTNGVRGVLNVRTVRTLSLILWPGTAIAAIHRPPASWTPIRPFESIGWSDALAVGDIFCCESRCSLEVKFGGREFRTQYVEG